MTYPRITLALFVDRIKKYYPATYKRGQGWVDAGELKVWPRSDGEPIMLQVECLRIFCTEKGLAETTVDALFEDLGIKGF